MGSASKCSAIVLAGGMNSRMGGVDKAFLGVEGEVAIDRILRALRVHFDEVVVVTAHPEKYRERGVPTAQDHFPKRGPLAGIHAGLVAITSPYAFVLACDMPFVAHEPIEFLTKRVSGQHAIVPCWEGDIEPLHAIYARELHGRLGESLQRGTRAIREFLPSIRVDYVPETALRAVPRAEESFRNLNTPEVAARYGVTLKSN